MSVKKSAVGVESSWNVFEQDKRFTYQGTEAPRTTSPAKGLLWRVQFSWFHRTTILPRYRRVAWGGGVQGH